MESVRFFKSASPGKDGPCCGADKSRNDPREPGFSQGDIIDEVIDENHRESGRGKRLENAGGQSSGDGPGINSPGEGFFSCDGEQNENDGDRVNHNQQGNGDLHDFIDSHSGENPAEYGCGPAEGLVFQFSLGDGAEIVGDCGG